MFCFITAISHLFWALRSAQEFVAKPEVSNSVNDWEAIDVYLQKLLTFVASTHSGIPEINTIV